jgi:hypothetical protein
MLRKRQLSTHKKSEFLGHWTTTRPLTGQIWVVKSRCANCTGFCNRLPAFGINKASHMVCLAK